MSPGGPDPREAAALCRGLVEGLKADGRIRSTAVEVALRAVPRHAFAPDGIPLEEAYADRVIVLATGADGLPASTISQPTMVACMLEQLAPRTGHRVLEIGTASGYNAALLARMVGGRGRVASVEVEPRLAARASERLARAGVRVDVRVGDGWQGVPDAGPYDRILATVGVWDLSPAWLEQLRSGGVLVAPLWLGPGVELSVAFRRVGDELHSQSVHPCAFLRLRGPHAGPDGHHPLGGDRYAAGELLSADAVARLRALLETRPANAGRPPPLGNGWAAALALADPRTIRIVTINDPPRAWCGLFDAAGPSLALVTGRRMLAFGEPGAADDLRDALADSTPFATERLTIRATPHDTATSEPPPRWLIRRPAFDYAVDGGA